MSDYQSKPDDLQAINERMSRLESALRAVLGANALESAVIGAGGITVKEGGGVTVTGGGGVTVEDGSAIIGTYPDGSAAVYFGSIGGPGDAYDSGVMIQDLAGSPRAYFAQMENGDFHSVVDGTDTYVYADETVFIEADNTAIRGDTVASITTPQLMLLGLPQTSAGANMHLGYIGGLWTVAWVTSSARYKQDIADAEIDPDAVLTWRPRTWRDKAEVEAVGDDATEHIGFIAEEIHDATPEFVVTDDEGRPDSLKYDRMVAGLVALAQKQAEQIADLTEQNADLTARVEALEAP